MAEREGQALLRRLTDNDDGSVRMVLALRPEATGAYPAFGTALTPRVRMLVRLAALIAVEASTASLRWAVELASCAGADDDEIVRVLTAVGRDVGAAKIVGTAPRLALAIGYDVEAEGPPVKG